MEDEYWWNEMQEDQEAQTQPDPEFHQRQEKKIKNRRKNRKKEYGFGSLILRGTVFGLTAAVVFTGASCLLAKVSGVSPYSWQISRTVSQADLIDSAPETEELLEETGTNASSVTAYLSGSVAGVAQAATPSVVAITSVSIQEIRSFFGIYHDYASQGSGSGIIVGENDQELLIATNDHVISGASTLNVFFYGNDVSDTVIDEDANLEGAVRAYVKGTDEENDLAVIAVKKQDLSQETMNQIRIAQLGDSEELVVGEQVVAIGNALGYGQTVTSGWISALNRSVSMSDGRYSSLIQTDAAINPGNSGGALLNMRGEVIGINSAKYSSSSVEGTGFAIPISKALPILEKLMIRKTREKVTDLSQSAFLGIQVADISEEAIWMYDIPQGAFVTQVTEGEAAEKAGIMSNDIILKLDGEKVTGKQDLITRLQYYEAGETIEIVLARITEGQYQEQQVEVTLGTRPGTGT